MANFLKMEKKQAVLTLLPLGWSYRQIERETGVRRETTAKYDPEREAKAAKVAPGVAQSVCAFPGADPEETSEGTQGQADLGRPGL